MKEAVKSSFSFQSSVNEVEFIQTLWLHLVGQSILSCNLHCHGTSVEVHSDKAICDCIICIY